MSHEAGSSHATQVTIHIDRQPYNSPTPTTGRALYDLAGIPAHRELFREVEGDREDQPVDRNDEKVVLNQDEHFYSQREIVLVVNAQKKPWAELKISYAQVTHLAFPEPPPPGIVITYTVEYEGGPRQNREGSMTEADVVYVKQGMMFGVTETGRS